MKANALQLADRLAEYRSVLTYRWRWLLVIWVVLATVFSVIVARIPNRYTASTTILAYPSKVPEKYVSATIVDDPADRLALLQQETLSATRLGEVIQKFGLYRELVAKDGRDAAVLELRKQIKIQTSHGTSNGPSAFTLSFTGDNPVTAAAVANELANSFILKNISNREQEVQGTTQFIGDQLDAARDDLQNQDNQLRIFRMGHLGEMPDQMNANLLAIGQLQAQFQATSDKIAQLDEEKILLKNAPQADPRVKQVSAPDPGDLLRTQLAQEKQHLDDLLTHVTPQHPDVIVAQARIRDLTAQLAALPKVAPQAAPPPTVDARLQVIDDEREHLVENQAAIRSRLNSYQAKVDAVPLRQEQLSQLTRDYETARDHYRSLLEKYYSAQMASDLEEKQDADRFEVLDPAVPPEHPTAPNRPALWGASVVVAFAGSFILLWWRERMDGSIKSELDLIKILPLELEFAGVISTIVPAAVIQSHRTFDVS